MREDIRRTAVYSAIVLLSLCFACRAYGQTIEVVSLVIDTSVAAVYELYSGCGIDEGEIDELNCYMSHTKPMSELIEDSSREFHLGASIDTLPRIFGTAPDVFSGMRACYWKPDDTGEGELDWDCSEGSSQDDCYCNDDLFCDPREGGDDPGTGCKDLIVEIPFLDPQFEVYQQLLERDFPYYNLETQTELPLVCRKMGPPNLGFAEEVFAHGEGEIEFTAQALIYALPPWMVHVKTEPQELAKTLLDAIDAITAHFSGRVDRWVVVNEAVRSDAPPAALLSGISATQECMHVSNSAAGCLGNSFPLTPAIEGEDDAIPVYALLDNEIVKIKGRIFNGQGECLGECNGECDGLPANQTTFYIERSSTSAEPHDANCIIYTLKSLIQQERMGPPPNYSGFWCPEPEGETPEIVEQRYWLWHTLTDVEHDRAGDVSDVFLVEAFKHARNGDSDAKLFYNGNDGPFASEGTWVNQHFENTKALLKLLKAYEAPVDGYGAESHLTAWWFLIEAESGEGEDGIRLCPRNIQGFIDRLTAFSEIFNNEAGCIALTELDVRMGIPDNGPDPLHWNEEYKSVVKHTSHQLGGEWITPTRWETAGTAGLEGEGEQHERNEQRRQVWQGQVYKAVLNAALSVPKLYSVTLWSILDEYSWLNFKSPNAHPYTPKALYWDHASDGPPWPCNINTSTGYMASNPCILGAALWDESQHKLVGNFYRKPAYNGVREAIENYFGTAFIIKDTAGTELVRFAKNGNVIVLKGSIYPNSNISSLSGEKVFAVMDSDCYDVAVVTVSGDLYLKGTVYENQNGQEDFTEEAAGVGLVIKSDTGEVEGECEGEGEGVADSPLQSFIDEDGNLKTRGEVIVKGVPYTLDRQHGSGAEEGERDPLYWK